jgi:hypothetical protein
MRWILGNNVWVRQAYAFVHMCLYGEHDVLEAEAPVAHLDRAKSSLPE